MQNAYFNEHCDTAVVHRSSDTQVKPLPTSHLWSITWTYSAEELGENINCDKFMLIVAACDWSVPAVAGQCPLSGRMGQGWVPHTVNRHLKYIHKLWFLALTNDRPAPVQLLKYPWPLIYEYCWWMKVLTGRQENQHDRMYRITTEDSWNSSRTNEGVIWIGFYLICRH